MSKNPIHDFWRNISDCLMEEGSFLYAKVKLIHQFRKTIEDSTETAKSIDRKDSRHQIAEYAEKEGFKEFAKAIRFQEIEETTCPER